MKHILSLLSIVFLICFNVYGQTADEYFNRGDAKDNLQDYTGAIADFNKAIEINPKHINAYIGRAEAKRQLKDYRGVIIDCNKVIEIDPQLAIAFYLRGIAKIILKEKNSGCIDLSKAGELGLVDVYDLIRQYCK